MINNLIGSPAMGVLEKALDGTSLRNSVISDNLANVDTPGFKRSDVYFEDELKKALNNEGIQGTRTDARHIPIGTKSLSEVTPQVVQDKNTSGRVDGNNVDIDNEMSKLAKNTIMYNALVQGINSEFNKLSYAITEGRK